MGTSGEVSSRAMVLQLLLLSCLAATSLAQQREDPTWLIPSQEKPRSQDDQSFCEGELAGTSDTDLYQTGADKVSVYDSLDADVVQSYMEYSLASLIYYALREGATSEQSSRMTAMDNSSKNAGEMIDKLRITFNRTRQAVITGELIEIISGAAAL